jgi:hypothetical protein
MRYLRVVTTIAARTATAATLDNAPGAQRYVRRAEALLAPWDGGRAGNCDVDLGEVRCVSREP